MASVVPVRLFHSSIRLRAAVASTNKSLLGQLRKSTGYSISHCKKALELHNNDVAEANKWLAAEAQAAGWAKATKLAGRSTSQGQLGLSVTKDNCHAAMLELNCETDFVSRNSIFVELATELTETCLVTNSTHPKTSGTVIQKELWNKEQVSEIKHSDGKTLADKVALSIGLLGENMILTRALKMSAASKEVQLFGYTHPGSATNTVAGSQGTSTLLGRYGVVVAVRSLTDKPADTHVLKHLCLQIIGMNPECIGTAEDMKRYLDITEAEEKNEAVTSPAVEGEAPVLQNKIEQDKFLLKQVWLDDDETTVEQVLDGAGLEVLDFVRMEVGQCRED